MSGFCPEGVGTCADANAGPCVVGRPCQLYPHVADAKSEPLSTEQVSLREPCLWGSRGLPACQPGVRAERYWCHACTVARATADEKGSTTSIRLPRLAGARQVAAVLANVDRAPAETVVLDASGLAIGTKSFADALVMGLLVDRRLTVVLQDASDKFRRLMRFAAEARNASDLLSVEGGDDRG